MKHELALESYPQTFLVDDDGRLRGHIEGGREWDQRDMRIWLRERLGADFASANTN